MKHVLLGLSPAAKTYLDQYRLPVGGRCSNCCQEVPEEGIVIGELRCGDQTVKLMRHMLKVPGVVADEVLQAKIETRNEVRYYLELRLKPDGILAFGNGRSIQWDVATWQAPIPNSW